MNGAALFLVLLAGLQDPGRKASYRLPFEDGKSYPLTQGNKGTVSHSGYCEYAFDFGMAEGTRVCAARDGKVVFAADDETVSGGRGKYGGSGNHIKIDHGDGTIGQYFHLKPKGVFVKVSDLVLQGDVIGLSGATGNVTGPHLHFQVDKGGRSAPVAFDDVENDAGVPKEGKSYTSKNVPGIPAPVKEKLSALFRAATLAEKEGGYGIAWRAWKQFADEKLKVKYPPQDEARSRMEAIVRRAEEAAKLQDPVELARARRAFEGVPTDAFKGVAEDSETRVKVWTWDRFYRGLKDEAEGKLASARGHYKNVLSSKPAPELAKQSQARLDAVEALLKAQFTNSSGSR